IISCLINKLMTASFPIFRASFMFLLSNSHPGTSGRFAFIAACLACSLSPNKVIVSGFGPIKISMELKQKGISPTMIQETSQQEELDFDRVVKDIYLKKYKGVAIGDLKDKMKRQNYLYQRGFGSELIRTVIPH
ncbi:MAG: RecX family transcriptional regulator, partial [Proteobacteria bacterium]|nr:RecX family transcriptional regulator [Pseudomonadota bacterium]